MSTTTIRWIRKFNGDSKGEYSARVRLDSVSILRRLRRECGNGWGAQLILTIEQIQALGGSYQDLGDQYLHGAIPSMELTCSVARPARRPRLDPTAARVNKTLRAHPNTWLRLDAEAKRTGESTGQVLDRLAASLPL